MSTLSELQRQALVLVYDLWVFAGLTVCLLYGPVLLIRVRKLGPSAFIRDTTSLLLTALLCFVSGTVIARGYFLVQLRRVNLGAGNDVQHWIDYVGWAPVFAQSVCVVGLGIFIHVYFMDAGLRAAKGTVWKHLGIGWAAMLMIFGAEFVFSGRLFF